MGDILSHLNVEEAVRTSTLSSTWRDAWTDMPVICLRDGNFTRTKFITLVDMVLSLHKGTIEEFYISVKRSYHDELARWMLMLSRRSPRSDMDIKNLISFCPVLTDLRLVRFEGIRCLNIQAPKLEYLKVVGGFEDINLDAPNLEWAFLSLNPKAKAYQSVPIAHDMESYVRKSLGSLTDIKTLAISGIFMKYLSKGCILTKFPAVFHRLEHIYLVISFSDQRQVLTTCSLLQNAPNLKKLDMWSHPSSTRDQDQASIQELTEQMQMVHLVTASVKCSQGLDYEIDFVAKLLSWSPALEEVKIEWKGEMDRSMVLTKLLALPRVSPRAKIIVT
ncbi:uncharacterized protein [Triticum aestivum]|uniref:uncharacterized protein n=1 Tax=Triticum aestivum TaxID=4565 RepID=UPI000843C212|nr:uncharacterized protein LOC123066919 [Triticum aestivum]